MRIDGEDQARFRQNRTEARFKRSMLIYFLSVLHGERLAEKNQNVTVNGTANESK